VVCTDIQRLINYSIKNSLIESVDEIVVRNQLMEVLDVTDWQEPEIVEDTLSIDEILEKLVNYACEYEIIEDTTANRDLFDTKLMGIVTALPREVIRNFWKYYNQSPKQATDWYYDYSQKLNYVRAGRIAKDMKWQYESEYGTLDITINLSKPEKDPRDIAAAGKQKASAYPKCQLCVENMGFAGNNNHPARQNLRPIPLEIQGQKWELQYSPYGYYNEHCIVFNDRHIPMVIDSEVFKKLFDFIEICPHYFVGSNADLPIVGGSILSHEHFQGGNYTFAMAKAEVETEFEISDYPDVCAGIVKWPMSVIRLSSKNRPELEKACAHILKSWRGYSDKDAGIFAKTNDTPHNTITPIARKNGEFFECDLVLRNNITTEEQPFGVFHPNEALHHIKKENIGLIEVMGLAVLPARLSIEIKELQKAMLNGENLEDNPLTASHAKWAEEVLERHLEFSASNAEKILQNEIGAVFEQVLSDAGVFKRNEDGKAAFMRFVNSL
jgi:UDPglucose--hexose-1-phosphate uridylyltransferase